MKRIISMMTIIALLIGSLTLTACGEESVKYIKVSDIDKVEDEETRELLDSLSCLSRLEPMSCICILTKKAKGAIKIPRTHDGDFVTLVTAYPGACEEITSIEFGSEVNYLEHVCSFDSDNPSLRSVDFTSDSQPFVIDSFNHCSSLEEAAFEEDHYHYDISIRDSFNSCGALKKIDVSGIKSIENSFSDCSQMKTAVIRNSNLGVVKGSFNGCAGLETLKLYAKLGIESSFNACSSLEDIVLEHPLEAVTDSFKDCPVDISAIKPEDEKQAEQTEREEQARKDLLDLPKKALDKLIDSGAIPKPSGDDPYALLFDTEDAEYPIDQLTFNDPDVKKRLLAEPDAALDKVALVRNIRENEPEFFEMIGTGGKDIGDNYSDCRYVIAYDGFVSRRIDNYYNKYEGYVGGKYEGMVDRLDVTTVVFVIDAKTAQIISIRSVSTEVMSEDGYKVDTEAAEDYIRSLLE